MTEERMGILELLAGMLFAPLQTIRRAEARRSFKSALTLYLLVLVLNGLTNLLLMRASSSASASLPHATVPFLAAFLLLGIPLALMLWLLQASFFYLVGHLMGGRGTPLGVLSVCALVITPQLYLVPLDVLLVLARVSEAATSLVGGLAGLALLVWMAVLLVVGLREEHELATGQAVLLVLVPLLALIFLVFLVAMVVGVVAAVLGLGGLGKP
ncbi:YIP1 family protein [Desulfothermobacter acidiphilus]|uniref:YIP1 family protein n=1 Tax=Desulfothermobacter acidiphilus TaxID=1938353 RepID=UPI003F8C846E